MELLLCLAPGEAHGYGIAWGDAMRQEPDPFAIRWAGEQKLAGEEIRLLKRQISKLGVPVLRILVLGLFLGYIFCLAVR